MVERPFRDLTTDRLRHGVFHSATEPLPAIDDYIATYNQDPKPFIWTAKAKDILEKVIRANWNLSSKRNEKETTHYTTASEAMSRPTRPSET